MCSLFLLNQYLDSIKLKVVLRVVKFTQECGDLTFYSQFHTLANWNFSIIFLPCSRVSPGRDILLKDALELAGQIAKKSPVAMAGTKHNLNFSRDHSAQEGLEYMVKNIL